MKITETDLLAYVGREESVRLDFKQSLLLKEDPNKVKENLTKCVSAFANTYGGRIILGMKERKDGPRMVAEELDDGVSPQQITKEMLRDWIVDNIRPRPPGIEVTSIKNEKGNFWYVIDVPEGTDAYQSWDRLFYGRNDSKSEKLMVERIRSLMLKSSLQRGELKINLSSYIQDEDEFAERVGVKHVLQSEIERLNTAREEATRQSEKGGDAFYVKKKQKILSEIDKSIARFKKSKSTMDLPPEADFRLQILDFQIVNQGVKTIKNCVLEIELLHGDHVLPFDESKHPVGCLIGKPKEPSKIFSPSAIVYPHREEPVFTNPWLIFSAVPKRNQNLSRDSLNWLLKWNLYFDDAPSCSGQKSFVSE